MSQLSVIQQERKIIALRCIGINRLHDPTKEKAFSYELEWLPDATKQVYVWCDTKDYKTERGAIKGAEDAKLMVAWRIAQSGIKMEGAPSNFYDENGRMWRFHAS